MTAERGSNKGKRLASTEVAASLGIQVFPSECWQGGATTPPDHEIQQQRLQRDQNRGDGIGRYGRIEAFCANPGYKHDHFSVPQPLHYSGFLYKMYLLYLSVNPKRIRHHSHHLLVSFLPESAWAP